MSDTTPAKRQASEQTDKAAAKARRVARKPAVARPAYVQAKMAVSHPSDPSETEADQVADEISRMPRGISRQDDEQIQTASVDPGRGVTEPDQALAPKLRRRISRAAIPAEEQSLAPKLHRQADDELTTLRRSADATEELQRQADSTEQADVQAMADEPEAAPLRREAEEETAQTKLRRSEVGDDSVQPQLRRTTAPDEAPAQAKLRRSADSGDNTVQTRLQRNPTAADDSVQTALYREANEGDEAIQAQLLRAPESTPDSIQAKLNRAAVADGEIAAMDDGTTPETAGDAGETADSPSVDDQTEQQIDSLRGQGESLPDAIQQEMSEKFGHDFSTVRVHTDAQAASLCARINARAFAVGDDLFFAPGEFAPDTEAGRKLLAHELTHVVQQAGDASAKLQRAVEPPVTPAPESGSDAATKLADVSVLELPPIKHRHAALYTGAGARRAAGYRRSTNQSQITVWTNGVQLTEDTIVTKLQRISPGFVVPTDTRAEVPFNVGSQTLSTPWRSLRQRLLIPDWDRRGRLLTDRADKFQVDHMVELQVFGDDSGNAGNVIGNLELLKGSPNASSGSTIRNNIYTKVTNFLAAQNPAFNGLSAATKATCRRTWLQTHSIVFDNITRGEGRAGDDADWWTRTEIEEAAPLDAVEAAPEQRLEGEPGTFVLASGPGGVEIGRYGYSALQFEPSSNRLRNAMAGLRINEIQLDSSVEVGSSGSPAGNLQATWELPEGFRAGEPVTIPLLAVAPYCASPGQIPGLNTEFDHLSPVELPTIEMRDGAPYAEGQINPSIPLLRDHPISVTLAGNDLRFAIEFVANDLSLPVPGLSIEEGSISLFYSTTDGFGGSGSLDFGIDRLGQGNLMVEVSQRAGFSASGQFDFDTELFDRAQINIWYREDAFGGEGEIGIDSPDKIRGIRAANLTVGFGENQFNASGEVQPDIPGIQQAGLTLAYSEEEGLTIGGNLQLSGDVPGIESGSIDVTVRKQEEQWHVSATGTAVPSIPGINSQLTVSYEDGAITMEAEAQYQRGMLDGSINVGATNRTLDAEGNPTGEPGEDIVVYGGGSLTIQIAPWLQGTAGVQFAPNGEITVTGEIGLPDQLEIFPRAEIDKSIFSIAVQAPIVPGIVAEIGGGLGAVAGIGPGVIDQLRLGIEYNPAHEENTHITGDAHLSVPADAGLRLSVRAGIGLGITGASATGGLEIGGTLGITGAAEAGVHIDWMPSTGLEINADVSVHAQPSFTFDINGYVSVRALGFSVYDQTWELASFSFGSDYRFGISLPVHYREGEPFDVSLDDVEFEVPDIDTDQILQGLIDRVT